MTDSTETDIVERLRKHVTDRGGSALQNGSWQMMLEAADLITQLRADLEARTNSANFLLEQGRKMRDAAALDMRERCIKVAESTDRTGKQWLALCQTVAPSEVMRRIIVQDMGALAVLATESGGAT